jgi:hypothetical protein
MLGVELVQVAVHLSLNVLGVSLKRMVKVYFSLLLITTRGFGGRPFLGGAIDTREHKVSPIRAVLSHRPISYPLVPVSFDRSFKLNTLRDPLVHFLIRMLAPLSHKVRELRGDENVTFDLFLLLLDETVIVLEVVYTVLRVLALVMVVGLSVGVHVVVHVGG